MVRATIIQRQAGIAQNAGQQIVKVVRHAARQHAQALQLLRVAKLFFNPAALGDVGIDFQNPSGLFPLGRRDRPSAGHQ